MEAVVHEEARTAEEAEVERKRGTQMDFDKIGRKAYGWLRC